MDEGVREHTVEGAGEDESSSSFCERGVAIDHFCDDAHWREGAEGGREGGRRYARLIMYKMHISGGREEGRDGKYLYKAAKHT